MEQIQPEDYIKEIKGLKNQIAVLEQQLAVYQKDGAVGLYYELNRMINKTVLMMRKKNLDELATNSDKSDKEFDRMLKLIDNSIDYMEKLDSLKARLFLSGDEERDIGRKVSFVDTIAEKRY